MSSAGLLGDGMNSLLSKGVESMNQPYPPPAESIDIAGPCTRLRTNAFKSSTAMVGTLAVISRALALESTIQFCNTPVSIPSDAISKLSVADVLPSPNEETWRADALGCGIAR